MFKEMLKRTNYLMMLMILAFGLSFTSCSDDDDSPTSPVTIDESQVLVEYLETLNLTFPVIKKASDVNTALLTNADKIYLIDIRSEADFNSGHVAGAHNVVFADLLNHVESIDANSYDDIVIICYSGQTAAYGASLLRMMGHTNVSSMKWGMASWNKENAASWNNSVSNAKATEFTSDETAKADAGNLPVLDTKKTTGPEILRARVEAAFQEGFDPGKIGNSTLYTDLSKYYIVNYWKTEHYLDPGHVAGAIQYTPGTSLKLDSDLKTLPTDKPIVVYCYTGQTSAFVAAYLRVIGYDAKSLLFGANGMIYDVMKAKSMTAWDESVESHDYEKVTN